MLSERVMNIYKMLVLILALINIAYAEEYDVNSWRLDDDYFVENIDIDNNGLYETVVSYKLDDRLLFFINLGEKYELILETTNFSIDGGERFMKIVPVAIPLSQQKDQKNPLVMTIINSFSSGEFRHHIRYISDDHRWQLAISEYTTRSVNEDSSIELIHCKYEYDNLFLDDELIKNYPSNIFILNSDVTFAGDIFKDKNYCSSKAISD